MCPTHITCTKPRIDLLVSSPPLFAPLPLLTAHMTELPEPTLSALLAVFGSHRQLCAAAPAELVSSLLAMHLSGAPLVADAAPSSSSARAAAVPRTEASARQRLLLALLRPRGMPL